MQWPYRFVDLDKDQIQRRRSLLDNYGQFAQLSILLLPLIYQLLHCLRLLTGKLQRNAHQQYQPIKAHQSPTGSQFKRKKPPSSLPSWERINWWLNDEIISGWETRKQWLLAALWTFWLLFLVFNDTGQDYLHMTKRFGIVAASQLPIHYLLAAKGWSPVQFLTKMSHEELNVYHRILGRIILGFFACHATLYLNFFLQKGLLSKRIKDWDVILGLTAISSAAVLFTSSLAKIRDYSYRVFFYLHVFLTIFLLPVLYFHVLHLRLYILEAVVIFGIIILQRNLAEARVSGTINRIPGTNILSIKVVVPSSSRFRNFAAGQHIYIGFPSLVEKLRKNPFTIASTPKVSKSQIELYVRSLRGTTAMLEALIVQPQPVPLTVEGPYGSSAKFPPIDDYDRVLLVAGGIGATFTLPIYIRLLETMNANKVKFLWSVKTVEDAMWGLEAFKNDKGEENNPIELYVTTMSSANGTTQSQRRLKSGSTHMSGDGIELEDANDTSEALEHLRNVAKPGRPDLAAIVDDVFEENQSERVAILVCGPPGMGRNLRKEVGRWVIDHKVFWHNEEFGW